MSTAVAKHLALKNVESALAWEIWQNPDKSCPMELCFEVWPHDSTGDAVGMFAIAQLADLYIALLAGKAPDGRRGIRRGFRLGKSSSSVRPVSLELQVGSRWHEIGVCKDRRLGRHLLELLTDEDVSAIEAAIERERKWLKHDTLDRLRTNSLAVDLLGVVHGHVEGSTRDRKAIEEIWDVNAIVEEAKEALADALGSEITPDDLRELRGQ